LYREYNTHGHKLRFPPSKKAQFVTECGITSYKRSTTQLVKPSLMEFRNSSGQRCKGGMTFTNQPIQESDSLCTSLQDTIQPGGADSFSDKKSFLKQMSLE